MDRSAYRPAELLPVDAQVIEQSVPAAAHNIGTTCRVHKPKPLPPVKPQPAPVDTRLARRAPVTTSPAVALPAAAAPAGAQAHW